MRQAQTLPSWRARGHRGPTGGPLGEHPATSGPAEEPPAVRFAGARRQQGVRLVEPSLGQGLPDRRPHRQARHERGLQRVVDVRVPGPGARRGPVVAVELVGPHTGRLDEELLGVVDPGPVTVLVVLDVDLPASVVEQRLTDGG